MQSVHTLFKLAGLKWTGRVTRMPGKRLPKKELQELKHSRCGPKEMLQRQGTSLAEGSQHSNWVLGTTQNRAKWRCLISKSAAEYEAKKVCEAERTPIEH